MARCSFDVHAQEIVGTLIVGATVIMLRPHGSKDLDYLLPELRRKQVTYIQMVPAFLKFFIDSCQDQSTPPLPTIRTIDMGGKFYSDDSCAPFFFLGEIVYASLIHKLRPLFDEKTRMCNLYGPAETTVDCTIHFIEKIDTEKTISIGRPLPNYTCFLVDEFLQNIIVSQEGELLVGGVSVFAGYLERDDLTSKVLVEFNGQILYRTGDIARLNNKGLLYYVGRKDYQIKLHGQRIEVAEIEECVIKASSDVLGCVVVKWSDDYLIAYVESSSMNEEQLRDYCRSHLPLFMIPSAFIVLDRFPLNTNGKIDRKRLPTPSFTAFSTGREKHHQEPISNLEISIHALWCTALKSSQISRNESVFNIGGHSLLLMKLYQHYKRIFNFDSRALGIAQLFEHPSIADHARLIEQVTNKEQYCTGSSFQLHTIEGTTFRFISKANHFH
jgi:acyl-coenzyme A synthetase/AMP-(fatty) acid ligase